MPVVLEIENLVKCYGSVIAVDELSLSIDEGDVYGFLGPNGAGKTTTMSCCANLIKPTSGEVRIFGKPVRSSFLEIFRKTGCLIEAPAYYPYLSGRANLEVLARCGGRLDKNEIAELVELVGLGDAANRKYGTYSTGMKARLALAGVLLGKPRLVILDEPTNGLDPTGVELVRTIIRSLNREKGVSFFISSHNLDEIERMCGKLAMIDGGRLVASGRVADLLAPDMDRYSIECDRPGEAAAFLGDNQSVREVLLTDKGLLEISMSERGPEEAVKKLVEGGFSVRGLAPKRLTLEEFFRKKLGR